MNPLTRRSFLQRSACAVGAGLAARALPSAWARPIGSNDDVRIGIIGMNSKGTAHLKQLLGVKGVRIAAVCDVDPVVLARVTTILKGANVDAFATVDARELLARSDVDAVVVATGNYWHALMTVWACQAGKDVYVEKPMSHTVWEGRKMVEAAAKYGRVVQAGMQYSSEPGLRAATEFLRAGRLGKIQSIRTIVYTKRDSIGRRPPWYPEGLNYDMFCGPSPMVPLERDNLHYDWHWTWSTGNGDLGNNGVHVLGIALRMAGHTQVPRRVLGLGGRFAVDDIAVTPNTMLAVYDYPEIPLIYEQRGLPAKPGVNYMDQLHGLRTGVVVSCEGGVVAGLIGATAFDRAGKVIEKFAGDGGAGHMQNFLDAVRSRRPQDLAAPVEFGHLAAGVCHLGNISYRVGSSATAPQLDAAFGEISAAREAFDSVRAHLEIHDIDPARQPMTLGQWLQPTPDGDGLVGIASGKEADLVRARALLREPQRPPFVIPEQV